DANAIEQNIAADVQTRNGTIEDDTVSNGLLLAGGVVQPEHEPERARDDREREQPDQGVVCFSLHRSAPSVLGHSMQHARTRAMEIGLQPWMLGLEHRIHCSGFKDLALAKDRDPVADRVKAVEVMGYHENRHCRSPL